MCTITLTICDVRAGSDATWVPDDTIIFSDSRGLMRVPAAGGTPQLLLAPDGKTGERFAFLQFLPDGKSVLFTILTGLTLDSARVAVLDLKTRTHRVLINSALWPRYAPSGASLEELQRHATQYATLTPADRQEINSLITDQKSIDARLGALEVALLTDPSKALAVPLLRKDVEAIQERQRTDLAYFDGGISRLQTLVTSLFGLMIAVFGTLGGISLWRSRKEGAADIPASPPPKADQRAGLNPPRD